LAPGGILSVITYHSLEDRMVKNFMKTGNIAGEVNKDFYGKIESPFEIITRKPILPTEEEISRNTRSRSAKLRVAAKI
jgi:16S rRNA (cytosine1402-N4)-methyltransferase